MFSSLCSFSEVKQCTASTADSYSYWCQYCWCCCHFVIVLLFSPLFFLFSMKNPSSLFLFCHVAQDACSSLLKCSQSFFLSSFSFFSSFFFFRLPPNCRGFVVWFVATPKEDRARTKPLVLVQKVNGKGQGNKHTMPTEESFCFLSFYKVNALKIILKKKREEERNNARKGRRRREW